MSLPRLLIIGAMKAGTTSLYMDLASHRDAYLAQDKEPHALCDDRVMTDEGLADYAALYAAAAPGSLCCDASTGYAKRPDFEGVADRALKVLPEGFRVIYVIRNPIARIISQHHHEHFQGLAGPSVDEEVRRHDRYIQYSQYAYQLSPWLAAIGRERVRVVGFERYVKSRPETLNDLFEFLGLSPDDEVINSGKVYNRSQGKPVKNSYWRAVRDSRAYRRFIRPLTPLKLRLALQGAILPKATKELAPPSPETVAYIASRLKNDMIELNALLTPAELASVRDSLDLGTNVAS
jgi:hypothetical protein